MRFAVRLFVGAAASSGLAAAAWFAWLGWDHQYYYVDGVAQGPYRAWQVVGCGATVAVGAVAAHLWARRWISTVVIVPATIAGFAIPWSADASSDDTGLWMVGLFMIVVGGGIGLSLLLAAIGSARGALRRL